MTTGPDARPSIHVLAGTNGAGKSSVAGAAVRARGAEYFNPDEATRRILKANPDIALDMANGVAWRQGTRLLRRAILQQLSFAFETTLGGNTITRLLKEAHQAGLAVRTWYVGLQGPERHLARVRARVAEGGHDIPEAKIRERYNRSRENLIHLLPALAELWIYDNSAERNPADDLSPAPRLILHARDGVVRETCAVADVPDWAKPLFIATLRQYSI